MYVCIYIYIHIHIYIDIILWRAWISWSFGWWFQAVGRPVCFSTQKSSSVYCSPTGSVTKPFFVTSPCSRPDISPPTKRQTKNVRKRYFSPGNCQLFSMKRGWKKSDQNCLSGKHFWINPRYGAKSPPVFLKNGIPSLPETNGLHLKMDGWKTTFLLGSPIFEGMC